MERVTHSEEKEQAMRALHSATIRTNNSEVTLVETKPSAALFLELGRHFGYWSVFQRAMRIAFHSDRLMNQLQGLDIISFPSRFLFEFESPWSGFGLFASRNRRKRILVRAKSLQGGTRPSPVGLEPGISAALRYSFERLQSEKCLELTYASLAQR
jgi:hypothetical protein